MATIGNLVVRFETQNQQANAAIADTRRRLTGVADSADDATGATGRFNNELESTSSIASTAASALAVLASAETVRNIVRLADQYSTLQNRLRAVIDESQDLQRVTGDLLSVANSTRSSFDSTVDVYSKFLRVNDQLGASQQELLGVIQTVNQAVTLSGASSEAASAALMQLGQGLGAGALRGEELNSILEQTPVLAKAIADGLNITIAQLRNYGADGKLNAQVVFNALKASQEGIASEFEKTNLTISQSTQVLKNNLLEYVGSASEAGGATAALSSSILSLANNIENVASVATPVVTVLATVMAGRLAQGIATATKARIADTIAASKQLAADKASAAQGVRSAEISLRQAQAEQIQTQNRYAHGNAIRIQTGNTLLLNQAGTALAAVNQKVIGTENALAAATARYTAASTAAAVSTRALNGAMAILGGPVGAVITAVSALAILGPSLLDTATKAETLAQKAEDGATALNKLAQASSNVSLVQAQDAIFNTSELLEQQRKAADEARAEIERLQRGINQFDAPAALGGDPAQAAKLREELDGVNKTYSDLQANVSNTEQELGKQKTRLDEIFASQETLNAALEKGAGSTLRVGVAAGTTAATYSELAASFDETAAANESYYKSVEKIASAEITLEQKQKLIEQANEKRIKQLREISAANRNQVTDYQRLIGQYDKIQSIQNDYVETLRKIESLELSAIERKKLLARADQDRVQALKDLRSEQIAQIESRIQGGKDTGAVDVNRGAEETVFKTSKTFEEQARNLAGRIESGNMTAEGTAAALIQLRGFADKLGALGEGFDVEGMKNAVDNLASEALAAFKTGDQKPLTAEEYERVFKEAQEKAKAMEQEQRQSWTSITNIDKLLSDYIKTGESKPTAVYRFEINKDGKKSFSDVTGSGDIKALADIFQSISTAV